MTPVPKPEVRAVYESGTWKLPDTAPQCEIPGYYAEEEVRRVLQTRSQVPVPRAHTPAVTVPPPPPRVPLLLAVVMWAAAAGGFGGLFVMWAVLWSAL